jgi:hypothetical protein
VRTGLAALLGSWGPKEGVPSRDPKTELGRPYSFSDLGPKSRPGPCGVWDPKGFFETRGVGRIPGVDTGFSGSARFSGQAVIGVFIRARAG